MFKCRDSSVVERQPEELSVDGSIPSLGTIFMVKSFFLYLLIPVSISLLLVLKDYKISDLFSKKSSKILVFNNEEFLKEVDLSYFSYEKKIKDKAFLNFTEDKNKNLELLIKSWINFYQQESGYFVELFSCLIENDFIIVDCKIHEKEKINKSIIDEHNLFESIKETIKFSFPEIKFFYFFEDEKLLTGKNIFLNKDFEIINFEEEKKEEKNKNNFLVPLNENKKFEKILKNISKNFFQEIKIENKNLFLLNNVEPYSENWCKKLKYLNEENNLIFLNIYEGKKNKISLILNEKENYKENYSPIKIIENFAKNERFKILKFFFECKANILFKNSLIIEIEIANEEFFEKIKNLLKNLK